MSRSCRFAVAVHCCAVLALGKGELVTSDYIAGSVNTNPVVVRRILAALARAGIVRSQRGIAGGSVLARPLASLTLKEIRCAVEDSENDALHHQDPNPACPVGRRIQPVLQGFLDRADAARDAELAAITLADVMAGLDTPSSGLSELPHPDGCP